MKNVTNVTIVAASMIAGVGIAADHADAASFTFGVVVGNGALAGTTGSGTVSYDEALFIGEGLGAGDLYTFQAPGEGPVASAVSLDPKFSLSVSLSIFGQTFTEVNDIDYSLYPILGVQTGPAEFGPFDGEPELGPFDVFVSDPGLLPDGAVVNALPQFLDFAVSEVPLDGEGDGDNTTEIVMAGIAGFRMCALFGECPDDILTLLSAAITPTDLSAVTITVDYASVAPIPVPAALPLFGSGLAMLGFAGWRRKRKQATEAA